MIVGDIDSLASTVGPKVAKQENTRRQVISEGHNHENDEIIFSDNECAANIFLYVFKGVKTKHL
jgi:hypothetical protein